MTCAASQLDTTAICCSYQTIIVCSGAPTMLAYVQTVLLNPLCFIVCVRGRETET